MLRRKGGGAVLRSQSNVEVGVWDALSLHLLRMMVVRDFIMVRWSFIWRGGREGRSHVEVGLWDDLSIHLLRMMAVKDLSCKVEFYLEVSYVSNRGLKFGMWDIIEVLMYTPSMARGETMKGSTLQPCAWMACRRGAYLLVI